MTGAEPSGWRRWLPQDMTDWLLIGIAAHRAARLLAKEMKR